MSQIYMVLPSNIKQWKNMKYFSENVYKWWQKENAAQMGLVYVENVQLYGGKWLTTTIINWLECVYEKDNRNPMCTQCCVRVSISGCIGFLVDQVTATSTHKPYHWYCPMF